MMEPLTRLTQGKGSKFRKIAWNQAAEEAFTSIKQSMKEVKPLYHLQQEGEIRLYTDASMTGIGAALFQEQDNILQPILFLSQKLSETGKKWSTIEQECFALYSLSLL